MGKGHVADNRRLCIALLCRWRGVRPDRPCSSHLARRAGRHLQGGRRCAAWRQVAWLRRRAIAGTRDDRSLQGSERRRAAGSGGDRKSGGKGKGGSAHEDIGGRRITKKKTKKLRDTAEMD